MASDDVATLDLGSLDAFRAELVEAGFEPAGEGIRRWDGPIAEPLRTLTTARTMCIRFEDGWPYRPPKLFVDGIVSEHAVTDGELCLFQPGDDSMVWVTFAGFRARIAEWVEHQDGGFRFEDAMLDAHLYFTKKSNTLATLDISSLKIDPEDDAGGRTGDIYGKRHKTRNLLELSPSRPEGEFLAGRWYYHGKLVEAPPRDFDTFREALTKGQQTNLDRRIKTIRDGGGSRVFALLWETRYGGRNALVLTVGLGDEGRIHVEALEVAPTDKTVLQLRAGPDVRLMSEKLVIVFGVGSIGSNIAARLAEAGLGHLKLVDGDTLRPGNIVRHYADFGVGAPKALITELGIHASAPWTKVDSIVERPWAPERLEELLTGADAAVDATGMATFAELLGRVAQNTEVPMVSAALYRGGSIGRVRRQRPTVDTALRARTDENLFPLIPPGFEPISQEAGCSAPVNNASPISVAAIAATTAQVLVDLLTNRLHYGEELIDVYQPLDAEPFTHVGRLCG